MKVSLPVDMIFLWFGSCTPDEIILQSSLLTLFCIFLDSTGAQNKKLKTFDIQKDTGKILAQTVVGQKFNSRSEISDEKDDKKKFKSKKKCKGKSCKYESSDEDDDSLGGREESSRKYMEINENGKYSNDLVKVRKPLKLKAGSTRIKNYLKDGSSEESEDSDEEEKKTNSKNRIIENVIFVKDKLAHLKKKIGNIDQTEFDSRKKIQFKTKKQNHKDYQMNSKSDQTNEINRLKDEDGSSEEQKSYKESNYKIKSKLLDSEDNTQRKKQRSRSDLYESKKNEKKLKIIKNTEADKFLEKKIESDEAISKEDTNTCEKLKEGSGKQGDNCNDDEGDGEESILQNNKYKFSIKYAHEKKKVFHNKNDHFVKKLHGVNKKKHWFGDEDDDSDEDEEFPKRLHHVTDDEE